MKYTYSGSVTQGGVVMARVYGADMKSVKAELAHYATMYAQDGPVSVRFRRNKPRKKA